MRDEAKVTGLKRPRVKFLTKAMAHGYLARKRTLENSTEEDRRALYKPYKKAAAAEERDETED